MVFVVVQSSKDYPKDQEVPFSITPQSIENVKKVPPRHK
jgi:hypothetical protein